MEMTISDLDGHSRTGTAPSRAAGVTAAGRAMNTALCRQTPLSALRNCALYFKNPGSRRRPAPRSRR